MANQVRKSVFRACVINIRKPVFRKKPDLGPRHQFYKTFVFPYFRKMGDFPVFTEEKVQELSLSFMYSRKNGTFSRI